MKQLFFLFLVISFFNQKLSAQEKNCEVSMETIKGIYTGDCEDGKAKGKGKSVGTDIYEGEFKKGYPEGFGKYTWQNKNFYVGNFKKGNLEGSGEMHYVKVSEPDSIVKGFWKKNKYIGIYERPYYVQSSTSHITKVDCRLIRKNGNSISITTHPLAGTGARNPVLISVSNVSVFIGSFISQVSQDFSSGTITRLQEVVFPFRATFFLSNGDQTDIIFNEPGEYDVTIDIL